MIKKTNVFLITLQSVLITLALLPGSIHLIKANADFYIEYPVMRFLLFAVPESNNRAFSFAIFILFFLLVWKFQQKKVDVSIAYRIAIFVMAIYMIIGKSYSNFGSSEFITGGKFQTIYACIICAGYYFFFKVLFLILKYGIEKIDVYSTKVGISYYIFDKKPMMSIAILFILSLPYIFILFPGVLSADSTECIFGKYVSHSITRTYYTIIFDLLFFIYNIGLKIFATDTGALATCNLFVFLVQLVIFSYSLQIMRKINTSYVIRWIALLVYTSPVFGVWGMTLCKDTPFYLAFFMYILLLIDEMISENRKYSICRMILFFISLIVITISRNNGPYIAFLSCILSLFVCKKNKIRLWMILGAGIVILTIIFTGISYRQREVPKIPYRENISLPLQALGRSVRENGDEFPEEVYDSLQELFDCDVHELGNMYNPILSDPIKFKMKESLSKEEIHSFWKVWIKLLKRYPKSYIEAFVEHTYGYFYLDFDNPSAEYGYYSVEWSDYVDEFSFHHLIKNSSIRDALGRLVEFERTMPVINVLFNVGAMSWFMVFSVIFYIKKNRYDLLPIFVPGVLMFSMVLSPANGYFRYYLPVLVCVPIWLSFFEGYQRGMYDE